MSNLKNIVSETINRYLLQEMLTSPIFHFTNINAALNICKNNVIALSEAITKTADTKHKTKMFYLSFTRQFNGNIGYSRHKNVRIEFDGDALNSNFEGNSFNYWGDRSMWEFEDRLYSNEPYIENANRYIKKISILYEESSYESVNATVYHILLCASQWGIEVAVFDNEKDFNNPRSTNTINDKIKSKIELFDVNPYRFSHKDELNRYLPNVIDFCVTLENIQFDEISKYVNNLLKTYNLERYSKTIIEYVKKQAYRYKAELPYLDNLNTISNKDNYILICKILRDVLKKYNLRNVDEANKYWRDKRTTKSQYNDYDTNKVVKVLCFEQSYNTKAILNPESTPFWSIFNIKDVKYYKSRFIEVLTNHDEYYGVRSHKSKDNNSFDKYIKHLAISNKTTVLQMLDILKKIDYDGDVIDWIFDGTFVEKEIQYWDAWKYASNEAEEQKIKELFKK